MRLCHDCKCRGVLTVEKLEIDAGIDVDVDVLDSRDSKSLI